MQNNALGKVSMKTDKIPASRFPLSNDFNTTLQFGVVYPTHVKYCDEDVKKVDSRETLFYLAPMPVRTFGRLRAKMYHQFVAFADLFPKLFPSMMAQTPYAAAAVGNINGGVLPYADSRIISSFALLGSKLSVWLGYDYENSQSSDLPSYENIPADNTIYSLTEKEIGSSGTQTSAEYTAFTTQHFSASGVVNASGASHLSILSSSSSHRTSSWADPAKNSFGCKLPQNTLLLNPFALFCGENDWPASSDNSKRDVLIPLGVDYAYGCTSDYLTNHPSSNLAMRKQGYDVGFYGPGTNSDVVVTRFLDYTTGSGTSLKYHRRRIYYCFRLSDYGKRFKAFLEGCDYKPDFQYGTDWALAPLLATYKAYYDLFSINLYENFVNSSIGKLCNAIDNGAYWSTFNNLTSFLDTCNYGSNYTSGLLSKIIYSFGDMFYTKEQDYLGAHIPNTGVSPNVRSAVGVFYDVDNQTHISGSSSQHEHDYSAQTGQAHAYIDDTIHGQLDSEFLKRAYRWVNRNTIAGQRIAEILRAQGLGDYVDQCKSNFIGYEEVPLKIDSILAQSDTFQNAGDGAQLGQRAGVGIGYSDGSKSFTFTNNEIGLTISFVCIVPHSGYCQGSSPVLTKLIGKNNFYQPMADSLGFEATTFESILDTTKSDGSPVVLQKTFGLVPQESKFKVARNKMSGNFSLASEQDSFLPYTLDFYMPLNKLLLVNEHDDSVYTDKKIANLINPLQLEHVPTCGEPWRKIGKYAYIQNLNRIFSYKGVEMSLASSVVGNNWSEYVVRSADNFIMQMIDNDQSYMHMKPLEASFETDDDGKTDTSMDKA